MNVLYASDDYYVGILGISILSLLENNQKEEDIRVYIVDDDISEDNRLKIEGIFEAYHRPLPLWKKIRSLSEVLGMELYEDRFSETQFARLLLEEIIEETEDRILYLDCDTIVNRSLAELWNMDLQGNVGAVLADAFSALYRKNIGLKRNDLMFNSGVILIDMLKWREENIGHQLRAFVRSHNGKVQQGDQGVLNAVLNGKVCLLSPEYNWITNYSSFSYDDMLIYRKPVNIYSKEEIEKAADNPCIIHYTSSFMVARPWEAGREHPYKALWDKYRCMSPWSEGIYKEKRMKKWKKLYVHLINAMPYKINLHCSGILQAYVRPLYGRWKYSCERET